MTFVAEVAEKKFFEKKNEKKKKKVSFEEV